VGDNNGEKKREKGVGEKTAYHIVPLDRSGHRLSDHRFDRNFLKNRKTNENKKKIGLKHITLVL
jgi:hypothetical protein